MNKEQVIEQLQEIKQEIQEELDKWCEWKLTKNNGAAPIPDIIDRQEKDIQALDIAIESLEQNIQTIIVEREFTLEEMDKGLEYCTYKAHRELIKRLLELKLIDIKSMNDIFGKGTVEFRLKVVEPYERKE